MQHIQLGVKQRVKSNIVKLKSSNAPCFSGECICVYSCVYTYVIDVRLVVILR